MSNLENTVVFSRPVAERLLVNYGAMTALVLIGVIAAIQIFFDPRAVEPVGWVYVLSVVVGIGLVMEFMFRGFAYSIAIDRAQGTIEFDMFRGTKRIKARIDGLIEIQVGIYISFLFDGRRVRFNAVTNKELVDFLETLKTVTWRRMGRLIHKYW
jgi:hypothetical protein